MKIVVLVKYVPEPTATWSYADDLTLDRAGVEGRLSELDEYAVEQALQLTEKGLEADIVYLTMGPAKAVDGLRKALSMGGTSAVHVLDEIEALGGDAVDRVVGQPAEEARQRQADVTAVFGFAERLPLGVLDGVEDLGEVTRLAQVGVGLEAEQLGRRGGDERGVRSGGHVRHLLDEEHVFGLAGQLELPDQRAER